MKITTYQKSIICRTENCAICCLLIESKGEQYVDDIIKGFLLMLNWILVACKIICRRLESGWLCILNYMIKAEPTWAIPLWWWMLSNLYSDIKLYY